MDPTCSKVIEIEDDDQDIEYSFQLTKTTARKIIFCIDISLEMNTEFRASLNSGLNDTNMYYSTRLETTQRFLKRYTYINALMGNNKDEYAIMLLSNKAIWWRDFTRDTNLINNAIDLLDGEVVFMHEELDTQSVFDTLATKVNVQDSRYFVQTILIYSRGSVVPTAVTNDDYLAIRESPNFTLDVVFLHDKMSNFAENIYEFWNRFDSLVVPGWYYETGVFKGKDTLCKSLAQLIGHPLQRSKDQEHIEFY